jgi:hypothetical protein
LLPGCPEVRCWISIATCFPYNTSTSELGFPCQLSARTFLRYVVLSSNKCLSLAFTRSQKVGSRYIGPPRYVYRVDNTFHKLTKRGMIPWTPVFLHPTVLSKRLRVFSSLPRMQHCFRFDEYRVIERADSSFQRVDPGFFVVVRL